MLYSAVHYTRLKKGDSTPSVFMGYMGCDTLTHFTLHKRTYRITSETFYHALLEKAIIYELQIKKQAYKILATAHSPLTGTE